MRPKATRRKFLASCSISTAALAALAPSGATGAAEEPGRGTPFLCLTCGSQFSETIRPPERCPICEDERQYVPPERQQWTTLEKLRVAHKNAIRQEEPDLFSINTGPKVGIGQRAFLVRTPGGNVLWDCVALIDETTIARVRELGGVAEIAVSHPHYYTTMVEWSRAFGDAPVHLHVAEDPARIGSKFGVLATDLS